MSGKAHNAGAISTAEGTKGDLIDPRALPCLWIGTDALLDRMSNAVVLVTEPGDINRPVALVIPCDVADDKDDHPEGDWREAVGLATDIAINADEILMSCAFSSGAVIDLRDIGRAGCGRPVPRWLLALRCHRMDAQGHRTGEAVYPTPFCLFMASQMLDALNAERSRAGLPHIAGAFDAGGQHYEVADLGGGMVKAARGRGEVIAEPEPRSGKPVKAQGRSSASVRAGRQ